MKKANVEGIKAVYSESGMGASDHTSFYLMNMPVLHFFTGQHEDYHKPSDDADKINWQGIVKVIRYSEEVIKNVDMKGELAFTKTKDESTETPSFKVTLGVIPDYLYNDAGMQIDGVRKSVDERLLEDIPAANGSEYVGV